MTRATPEMIAAAWATWKPRNPKSLGPGPAFVEAINAALEKMEQPAMTQQEKTSNPAPATCDMCGGTGLYGPDAVNCPCGITPTPAPQMTGPTDTQLLDALVSNSWDLRCISVPTGGDDHDIDWVVIEHHQAEPHERTVAQAYADDPRLAVRRALRETDKNAARCVSCDEVLHDGDSVYYEHGEDGHIHAWCTSDDPESFVDEDEVPLKAGDEIPKPFAYSVEKYEGQP